MSVACSFSFKAVATRSISGCTLEKSAGVYARESGKTDACRVCSPLAADELRTVCRTVQVDGASNVNSLPAMTWVFEPGPQPATIISDTTPPAASSLPPRRAGNKRPANQGKDDPSMAKTKDKVSDAAGTVKP